MQTCRNSQPFLPRPRVERFPWIRFYTPVNEIFVAATFSAQFGWWNERLKSDRGFVTALKNLCKANLLAMHSILKRQPKAIFIQSESTQYFHAEGPACESQAALLNEKRFLSLDLTSALTSFLSSGKTRLSVRVELVAPNLALVFHSFSFSSGMSPNNVSSMRSLPPK